MVQSRKYEVDRLLLREERLESMPEGGDIFLNIKLQFKYFSDGQLQMQVFKECWKRNGNMQRTEAKDK